MGIEAVRPGPVGRYVKGKWTSIKATIGLAKRFPLEGITLSRSVKNRLVAVGAYTQYKLSMNPAMEIGHVFDKFKKTQGKQYIACEGAIEDSIKYAYRQLEHYNDPHNVAAFSSGVGLAVFLSSGFLSFPIDLRDSDPVRATAIIAATTIGAFAVKYAINRLKSSAIARDLDFYLYLLLNSNNKWFRHLGERYNNYVHG